MRNNKDTKRQIIKKIIIYINIILIGGVIFLLLNGFGKLIYIYITVTFIIPILIFYIKAKLFSKRPKYHLVVDNDGKITKVEYKNKLKQNNNYTSNSNSNNIPNQNNQSYKPSQSPNLELDIYKQISKTFSNGLKNKLLKREDILNFKDQLNISLKENLKHYDGFSFKNDANEIYVKMKNKHLSQEDYEGLLTYLNYLLRANI